MARHLKKHNQHQHQMSLLRAVVCSFIGLWPLCIHTNSNNYVVTAGSTVPSFHYDRSLHLNAPYPGTYHGLNENDGTVTPALRLLGSSESHDEDNDDESSKNSERGPASRSSSLVVAYEETVDGYTVLNINGTYKYLMAAGNGNSKDDGDEGDLIDSGLQVGKDDPSQNSIPRHVRRKRHNDEQERERPKSSSSNDTSVVMTNFTNDESDDTTEKIKHRGNNRHLVNSQSWTGTLLNLVIPFKFSDHVNRDVPTTQQLSQLMNGGTGSSSKSVQDVFQHSSYGQMDLVSVVTEWVVLPKTEKYYAGQGSGDNAREMIYDALMEADARNLVNWNQFDSNNDGYVDMVAFFHSGYAAEWGGTDQYGTYYTQRIWSHKWALGSQWPFVSSTNGNKQVDMYHVSPSLWGLSGSQIGRIGVVAHETAHFMGLKDLYDIDPNDPGNGIGTWGLLGNSWGFDGSQRTPPPMSAYSKVQLGYVTPELIVESGMYELQPAADCTSSSSNGNGVYIYKISHNFPDGEYLLIENRQPCGYDSLLPQGNGGLAIWHIDEKAMGYDTQGSPISSSSNWPQNGHHYKVALLQADGGYDLEEGADHGDGGDLFVPGQTIGPNGVETTTGGGTGHIYPNTNSYQYGNVLDTGIHIGNIQPSDPTVAVTSIQFEVSFGAPPPTPAPTPVPYNLLTVRYDFDNWPTDIGWTLIRLSDNHVVASYPEGSYNVDSSATIIEDFLLEQDGDYEFHITDSFGDGLCCFNGYGEYKLFLGSAKDDENAIPFANGGEFGASDTVTFNVDATAASSTTAPTIAPFPAPVSAPVAVPTPTTSTTSSCNDAVLELRTDNFGTDFKWTLVKYPNPTSSVEEKIFLMGGGEYASNTDYTIDLGCLTSDKLHKLSVTDEWGDGICCNEGEGYFTLKVNGHVVKTSGNYGQLDEVWFYPSVELENGDGRFELEIVTDNGPSDVSWTLQSFSDEQGQQMELSVNGDTLVKTQSKSLALVPLKVNYCHVFEMKDAYGDGLTWGTPEGYFVVNYNHEEIHRGGGPNGQPYGDKAIIEFGNGCTNPSNTNSLKGSTLSSNMLAVESLSALAMPNTTALFQNVTSPYDLLEKFWGEKYDSYYTEDGIDENEGSYYDTTKEGQEQQQRRPRPPSPPSKRRGRNTRSPTVPHRRPPPPPAGTRGRPPVPTPATRRPPIPTPAERRPPVSTPADDRRPPKPTPADDRRLPKPTRATPRRRPPSRRKLRSYSQKVVNDTALLSTSVSPNKDDEPLLNRRE